MEEIMKKLIILAVCLLAGLGAVWAQGLENFNNYDYTGTAYVDGSFVGNNNITWNYYHVTGAVAGANDNSIDGAGMILRRSAVPSRIVSGPIPNGIGNFSVQMRKAYTSAGDRQVALYINNNWIADSQTFGGTTGADPTVHVFEVNGVNVNGDFTMEIRHLTGGDVNRQLTIDNITWTAYGSGMQFVATPTFNPPAGVYTQDIAVAISTTTAGATIRYTTNGTEPTTSSPIYSTPIPVTGDTTIKARGWADGYEPSAIATAAYVYPVVISNLQQLRQQAADNTTVYYLPNSVVLTFKQNNRNQKYIQDAGAGMLIDDVGGVITTSYNVGDAIAGLTGKLNMYFETMQFIPVANPGPAVSTGNNVFTPIVTIAEINANIAAYQSRLVRINNVHFDAPSGNYATNPAVNYVLSDATGTFTFRTTFYDVDYIGTPMHAGTFNLKGIIAQYQSTAQITPRALSDFNPPVSNEDPVQVPVNVQLIGNYPNPFNPNTTIQFSMDKAAPAQVTIYNQKGQTVKSFSMDSAAKGLNNVQWNGTDDNGRAVPSGVYYFRLKSGSYSSTKKMVLMK